MADWYSVENAWKQPKLQELGEVVVDADDLNQCISTILLTPRGSRVLEPEFASDLFDHVDKPFPVAKPLIIRDTIEAIQIWEPRVELVSVNVTTPRIAALQVAVVWRVKQSSFEGLTEVLLA